MAYLVPFITWYAANQGHFWSIPQAIFIIIPVLELLAPDSQNPTPQEEEELNGRMSFRVIPMIWVPLQVLLLLWSFSAVSVWELSTSQFILFAISIGSNTGVLGINIAHELIHKNTKLEVFLGKLLLVMVCYGHWQIEHVYGHHKRVSTPADPATAKLGESFYTFWPKSVWGTFWSSWDIAEQRRKAKKSGPLNEVLVYSFCSLIISICVALVWGRRSFILFYLQSFVAFSLLEIVNYIEHYGLERRKEANGYEAVKPIHSWNSDARITNVFLFKLQRHSDHHAFASRRYQILRSFKEAPQMPTGYAGMLFLALIPPLWFTVMDKRAKEFYHNMGKIDNQAQ
uniref:Fatty acid desaturase domain-containing protein n=1 Tax=Arcella intermedia TaxID=1963864 RepID=A0A6B2L8F0_9EUKA